MLHIIHRSLYPFSCLMFCWTLLYLNQPAFAQEAATYCANVTADECALVEESVAAMGDVASGRAGMTVDIRAQDVPELPADQIELSYEQHIDFSLGAEFATLYRQIQQMTQPQLLALGNNPAALLDIAQISAADLTLSLDLELEMSAAVASLLLQELSTELGVSVPDRLGLRLIIVDGFVYIHTESIAAFAPDIESLTTGWIGVEAAPLLDLARAQFPTETPSTLAGFVADGETVNGIPLTGAGIAVVDTLDQSDEWTNILLLEALYTEDGSDEEMRFITTVDYEAFFRSPLYLQLLRFFSTQQQQPLTEDELEEFRMMGEVMGPALLSGLDITLTESIQNETSYVSSGALNMTWDLRDLMTLAGQSDPSLVPAADASPFIGLTVTTNMDLLNQDVTIVPPADAFVLPTEMIVGFMQ